jgi:fibronectin-binding autotransporter adhesin
MTPSPWPRTLRRLFAGPARPGRPARRTGFRPSLEALEDRAVPATLTVTNLLDSGPGSLRGQIAASAAGDTVNFASGLSGTITLTSGELAVSHNLTVQGPGAGTITVSGNNAQRVFHTLRGTSVSISGLTIANGSVSDFGGGIESEGSLSLFSSTLTGNSAGSGSGGGLAFVVNNTGSASLSLTSDTFTNNTGANGAGLFSSVTNRYGSVNVSVSFTTFSSNTATGAGGALDSFISLSRTASAAFTLTDSNDLFSRPTFSNNRAASGGGLASTVRTADVSQATVSVFGVKAQDNTAQNGGGIFSDVTSANASQATVSLSVVTLQDDVASALGGGLYSTLTSTEGGRASLTAFNPTAKEDTAVNGGGVYSLVTLTGSGSASATFNNLSASANVASQSGGGLYSVVNNSGAGKASLTLDGGTVASNAATAGAGGGVFSQLILSGTGAAFRTFLDPLGSTTVTLNNLRVTDNAAGTDGGGVFADVSSTGGGTAGATVTNCTLLNNSTAGRVFGTGEGGGLRLALSAQNAGSAYSLLTGDTATGNTSAIGGGGIKLKETNRGSGTVSTFFLGPIVTNDNFNVGFNAELNATSSGSASFGGFGSISASGNAGPGISVSTSSSGVGQATATLAAIATGNSGPGINLTSFNSGVGRSDISLNFVQVSGNTGSGINALMNASLGTASLAVSNGTITGNGNLDSAFFNGGGMHITGFTSDPEASVNVTLTGLTIDGNSAFLGGGVYFDLFAGISGQNPSLTGGSIQASVTGCTLSNNHATLGGGIGASEVTRKGVVGQLTVANASATLTVTNSTIFSNLADSAGGGVFSSANVGDGPAGLTLLSDTIAFNAANQGGGIFANGTTVRSTIVADNTAATGPDASGTFTSGGHNLIGQTDGSSGWVASDLTGTTASPLDPLFGDFGNFGGSTNTLQLLSGSPAIGHGDPAGPATDQRGVFRSTTAPSIGAYEFTG